MSGYWSPWFLDSEIPVNIVSGYEVTPCDLNSVYWKNVYTLILKIIDLSLLF